eukprot:6195838-Pleurochrysis_carterae.AAC.1
MFPPRMHKHASFQEMWENDHPEARSVVLFHPEIQTLMQRARAELPHPDLVLVDMHVLFFGKKRFDMHQDRHADYIGWNLLWTVVTLLSDTDSSMHIAGHREPLVYKSELGQRAGTAIMFPSKLWHRSVEPEDEKADVKIVFFYGLKHTCSRKRKHDTDDLQACSCECDASHALPVLPTDEAGALEYP